MDNDTSLKRCSKCGETFPRTAEYFYCKGKNLTGQCKECIKAKSKNWRSNNAQRHRDKAKEWRVNHPDQQRLTQRAWAEKNPDKTKTTKQKYEDKNRELLNAKHRERYWNDHEESLKKHKLLYWRHKESWRTQARRRRANARNAEGNHTARDVYKLYDEQDGRCAYCGIRVFDKFNVDHFVPLAQKGSNSPDNLRITCEYCNKSKGALLYSDWRNVRGW